MAGAQGSSNYMHWTTAFLSALPSVLAKEVWLKALIHMALRTEALQDEWKKAVGRIPPEMSNIFVRFKVNSNVNYAA